MITLDFNDLFVLSRFVIVEMFVIDLRQISSLFSYSILSRKIHVSRNVRNFKSYDMTSSGEPGHNRRTRLRMFATAFFQKSGFCIVSECGFIGMTLKIVHH